MLKLTTDKHEASRGLSATAELLVIQRIRRGEIALHARMCGHCCYCCCCFYYYYYYYYYYSFCASARPDWQAAALCSRCLSVRPSVLSFVRLLPNLLTR